MNTLLLIRLSAMGDVAMLVPVLDSLARQYSDIHITMLTRKHLKPFFDWMPKNVEVMGIDMKDYKGVGGLSRLYKQLKVHNFDAVADMHDVLRTKYLRWRFRLAGKKCLHIDKGRKEKEALIGNGVHRPPLKPMVERYASVLEGLGLKVKLDFVSLFDRKGEDFSVVEAVTGMKKDDEKWVGIAPFAAHDNKIYPLDKMREVVESIASPHCRVFLFGAGKKENDILAEWESGSVVNICGKLGGLHNEMLLISQLDVMLAMDSANMHIASLVGTPVVSVWGPTHPKAGFLPWNQPEENIMQIEDMNCRPCSVYGNKPCQLGDLRCMNRISPEGILSKLKLFIS